MKQRVGIIGVGAMGRPLATHLLHEGYSVTICPHRNSAPNQDAARITIAIGQPRHRDQITTGNQKGRQL